NGLASAVTVDSGVTENDSGTNISGTVFGNLSVGLGGAGVDSNTVVSSGGLGLVAGNNASAIGTIVGQSGVLSGLFNATISNATVESGGQLRLGGAANVHGVDVSSGGTIEAAGFTLSGSAGTLEPGAHVVADLNGKTWDLTIESGT